MTATDVGVSFGQTLCIPTFPVPRAGNPRTVAILPVLGVQTLDVAEPLDVFAMDIRRHARELDRSCKSA